MFDWYSVPPNDFEPPGINDCLLLYMFVPNSALYPPRSSNQQITFLVDADRDGFEAISHSPPWPCSFWVPPGKMNPFCCIENSTWVVKQLLVWAIANHISLFLTAGGVPFLLWRSDLLAGDVYPMTGPMNRDTTCSLSQSCSGCLPEFSRWLISSFLSLLLCVWTNSSPSAHINSWQGHNSFSCITAYVGVSTFSN
jgi:hypothetical protein